MKPHALLIVMTGLTLAAEPRKENTPRTDTNQLQGVWNLVGGAVDGNKLTTDEVKADGKFFIQFIIAGNRITHKESGKVREQSYYRLDVEKRPRTIDLIPLAGPNKGKALPGIYELAGNTLRICLAPVGKERPARFVAGAGSGQRLFILKREKS